MGIMTIHAIHSLGHNLFMHIGSQTFFGMTFITNTIFIHFQERRKFGAMGQMTGRTITHLHRTMNIIALNKINMAHDTEFQFWADQSHLCLKVMTVFAFLFIIRLMPGHDSLLLISLRRQLFSSLQGQIFLHLLLMKLGAQLIRRRKAGNPFKDRGQDLMPGNLIATGQKKEERES